MYCESPELTIRHTVRQKNIVRVDTHERHEDIFLISGKRH